MTQADQPILLVADADEEICELVEQGLSPTYRILAAHDAQHARDFCMQMGERIHAVIADVDLPILDGVALTTWLLGQPKPPPLVLMSGGNAHTDDLAKELWGDLPGVHWLNKPFPIRKLRKLIETTLKKPA